MSEIKSIRIHPAIGIARVGNSADFFIGPEQVWQRTDPHEKFKDGAGRVKRQAARFRLFAYYDDGPPKELTKAHPGISITWQVHVRNKKPWIDEDNERSPGLVIDSGKQTVRGDGAHTGPKLAGKITFSRQSERPVPLGELRTDPQGHLVVLGGYGKSTSWHGREPERIMRNPGWYDDTSDGPVTATVTINGRNVPVVGAWIIVAPPKYGPHFDTVITLYDRLFQLRNPTFSVPAKVSYTNDVYPILRRAVDTQWTNKNAGKRHGKDWAADDKLRSMPKELRERVFENLRDPRNPSGGGTMPKLETTVSLTSIQYDIMRKWKDGGEQVVNDWPADGHGPKPAEKVTPDDLDRAALSACVGESFGPGIEVGGFGTQPILDNSLYDDTDRLRLKSTVEPGAITAYLANPWQTDFSACGENWWPVPRPNQVHTESAGTLDWDRGRKGFTNMVRNWHTFGFVLPVGNKFLEVGRAPLPTVRLRSYQLHFSDVVPAAFDIPKRVGGQITFDVSAPGQPVTLRIAPGDGPSHAGLEVDRGSITVEPTGAGEMATVSFRVTYQPTETGERIEDRVIVSDPVGDQRWVIPIRATTATTTLSTTDSQEAVQRAASVLADLLPAGTPDAVADLQSMDLDHSHPDGFGPARAAVRLATSLVDAGTALDVDGTLLPGYDQSVPFDLTEVDTAVDLILLTDNADLVDFRLLSPVGLAVDPARLIKAPSGVAHYRITLPLEFMPGRFDHAGQWRALLSTTGAKAVAYSLVAQVYSSMSMRATIIPRGTDFDAPLAIHASLTDAELVPDSARAWAVITRPDGSEQETPLAEQMPGRFAGTFPTDEPGTYRGRVRISGVSADGHPFQREQSATATTWHETVIPAQEPAREVRSRDAAHSR
ncbi:LodA/GoxA family CTQ-dependent oxidase [Actinocrispum wychmicini]|uniref:Uncharacterized protein n=1 Tax=Actinocrispum wychmicini TaxID=1213861 RepID=A0A4R2K6Z1_9PSEU|nr:LodA/GoxA family CTQ-dependent oxidase [Actinocrispum wychmicini]TCO62115.1 hypothetical protein EV192_102252 [Actinocrispum wychmicini]